MKIAVVGCGAVGSYYGARLFCSGQDVHFLLRSDYEIVRRQGLSIRSRTGDFHIHPACARTPEKIGISDLVLIALKTTANEQIPKLIPPLMGQNSVVLTLQNGLGNVEKLAELFASEQILGGLAFVCLNREQPGLIHHIDYGTIMLGEYAGSPTERTQKIAALFREADVVCEITPNLFQAHWEKLAWNIPFNGLGVAASAGFEAVQSGIFKRGEAPLQACLPTDKLLGDSRWAGLVTELMDEVIHTARALSFNLSDAVKEKHLGRTRTMGAYRASTLLDFEKGLPIELDTLFLEPLRRARMAGVKTPRLEALCAVLSALQAPGEI